MVDNEQQTCVTLVDHDYSSAHNRDDMLKAERDKERQRQTHRKWRQSKKDAMVKILQENDKLKSENQALNVKITHLIARLDQQREENVSKYEGLTYLMINLHTKLDELKKTVLT